MIFEFNDKKSVENKRKHGIDFEEAQALWRDEGKFELDTQKVHEARSLVIAKYKDKHWTATSPIVIKISG